MERPDNVLNPWRKSTYSGTGGSDCVEVGGTAGSVLVRDTKERYGAVLDMGPGAWRQFMATLKTSA
ncbi:MAG: DUF397 domain-containing protein [Streptosporangiales bacterium]|jgi:hypothetical protein|nr:DUF397 domain-containing protein [Streptosporangiales bacterium]